MNFPVSAVVVVRNEEVKISKCLGSLKGIVNEIILVHDGPCSDNTIDIAKKYGARMFVRDYVGEAEPHRVFSLKQASNNWILQIDADEFLTDSLRQRLPELISGACIVGYRFKWNIAFLEEKNSYDFKLALYRKDAIISFLGIPHETVKLQGKVVTLSDVELGHDRGSINDAGMQHKLNVWPKVHGEYMARYKYNWFPVLLLPFGYVLYPFYNIVLHLLCGRIKSFKQGKNVVVYNIRFWHVFAKTRLKVRWGGKTKVLKRC